MPKQKKAEKKTLPRLPDPVERSADQLELDMPGWWLVLSDTHLPFHDKKTIETALGAAVKAKAVGVILNGDILDCHELSRFDRSPDDTTYRDEVIIGCRFLEYVRHRLPKAAIFFKEGNHEERLLAYLCQKAPALYGLDALKMPSLLLFHKHSIEHVTDRRVIRLGKLSVIHGHEYRPGITAPVNPARGLFLRAKSVALCGHFHQTSEHQEPTITGRHHAAWSTGCACGLKPPYMPLNKWNLGYAMVKVEKDGSFEVLNQRVL